MKNLFKKYILGLMMAGMVLSFASVSAQQISVQACLDAGGKVNVRICLNSDGTETPLTPDSGGQRLQGADLGVIANLIQQIQGILGLMVPLMIGLAVVWFLWNLFQYFMVENADDKTKAMKSMGYGLLAIFVMVSIWGIINFFGAASGIGSGGGAKLPTLPTYQQ